MENRVKPTYNDYWWEQKKSIIKDRLLLYTVNVIAQYKIKYLLQNKDVWNINN